MELGKSILCAQNKITSVKDEKGTPASNQHRPINLINNDIWSIYRGFQENENKLLIEFDKGFNSDDLIIVLGQHNLESEDRIIIRLFKDHNVIPVYENTIKPLTPVYGWGEGPWSWNPGGYVDLAGSNQYIFDLFESETPTHGEIIIHKISGLPEMSFLYIGNYFQPEEFDSHRSPVSTFDIETGDKVIEHGWPALPRSDFIKLMPIVEDIAKLNKRNVKKLVFYLMNPGHDDRGYEHTTSMLGNIQSWTGPQRIGPAKEDYFVFNFTMTSE